MIQSRILSQEMVEWKKLKWFQGEDLKTITPEEMAKLKSSLKNNSFIQPFNVWDDGEFTWILDGHHRQMAMSELLKEGVLIADLLPANYIDCVNRLEAAKMVIVYSGIYAQIAKQGLVDFASEHQLDLSELALEIELPQFDLNVLANTSADEVTEADDVIPEVPEVAITEPGDLWQLGEHRLLCGDSLDAEVVSNLMGEDKAQIVFTDPPYNVSIKHISVAVKTGDSPHTNFAMAAGEMSKGEFTGFLRLTFANLIKHSMNGSIHFVCMDWRHMEEMLIAGQQYTEFKQLVVWNKTAAGMGSFYRSKYELIFVFKNGDNPHINNFKLGGEGRYRTNVWDYEGAVQFSTRKSATEGTMSMHPTVKPVKMVADALLDCSDVGAIVLDLFGGSGTTLIAAQITGRRARLMELSPSYCDVIVHRYINHCTAHNIQPTVLRNNLPFQFPTEVE
jgi:DNA modification methylase